MCNSDYYAVTSNIFFLLSINSTLSGQDTLAINLDQFLELSLKNAGQA